MKICGDRDKFLKRLKSLHVTRRSPAFLLRKLLRAIWETFNYYVKELRKPQEIFLGEKVK